MNAKGARAVETACPGAGRYDRGVGGHCISHVASSSAENWRRRRGDHCVTPSRRGQRRRPRGPNVVPFPSSRWKGRCDSSRRSRRSSRWCFRPEGWGYRHAKNRRCIGTLAIWVQCAVKSRSEDHTKILSVAVEEPLVGFLGQGSMPTSEMRHEIDAGVAWLADGRVQRAEEKIPQAVRSSEARLIQYASEFTC